ncbi:MAG TPA: hypothetical protein VLK55_12325 [Kocuria rosea]|nr:hypothetical protein [Kocuria rosea]
MSLQPSRTETPPTDEQPEKKAPALNIAGLIAGAASAATVAVIGGHLSVAGTVLGAALMSLISGVVLAVYNASLEKSRHGLKKVHATVAQRLFSRKGPEHPDRQGSTSVVEDGDAPAAARPRLKSVLISAGAVLGLAVVAVFGIQWLTGTELSSGTGQIQRTVTGTDQVAVRTPQTTLPGTTTEDEPAPGTTELTPAEGAVPTAGPTPAEVPTAGPTPAADVPAEEAPAGGAAGSGGELPDSGGQQPGTGQTGTDSGAADSGAAAQPGAAADAGAAPAAP